MLQAVASLPCPVQPAPRGVTAASPLPLGLAACSSSADMPMVSRLCELRGPGQGCAEEAGSRFLSQSSRAPQGLIVFPQPRSGRQERGAEGGDTGDGVAAVAGLGSRHHTLRALASTPPLPARHTAPLCAPHPQPACLGEDRQVPRVPLTDTGPALSLRCPHPQRGQSSRGGSTTARHEGERGEAGMDPSRLGTDLETSPRHKPPSPGTGRKDSPSRWMF